MERKIWAAIFDLLTFSTSKRFCSCVKDGRDRRNGRTRIYSRQFEIFVWRGRELWLTESRTNKDR